MDGSTLADLTRQADVVVIGTVRTSNGGGLAAIRPEAFLKGPVSDSDITPQYPYPEPSCALAHLDDGARVMAFLAASRGVVEWPSAGQVFWLRDGQAIVGGANPASLTERQLVQEVRGLTHQYAVPAPASAGGAGIGWRNALLPVGVALAVIFAVGLLLMRTWHHIDPS